MRIRVRGLCLVSASFPSPFHCLSISFPCELVVDGCLFVGFCVLVAGGNSLFVAVSASSRHPTPASRPQPTTRDRRPPCIKTWTPAVRQDHDSPPDTRPASISRRHRRPPPAVREDHDLPPDIRHPPPAAPASLCVCVYECMCVCVFVCLCVCVCV